MTGGCGSVCHPLAGPDFDCLVFYLPANDDLAWEHEVRGIDLDMMSRCQRAASSSCPLAAQSSFCWRLACCVDFAVANEEGDDCVS